MSEERLIPKYGGYRKLRSFQAGQLVYDATVVFCERFVDKFSRRWFRRRARECTSRAEAWEEVTLGRTR